MRKILITDDNLLFAENLGEILADSGYEPTIAASGSEALELAAATRFDALLSDMRMPHMGGAELVHRVRRMDPGLPAIVITAYTDDDDVTRARQEGLLAILSKPVPVPTLLELLAVARRDGLVAVIEDDAKLSDNLTEILREHGFGTVTATSVLETERLGDVSPCLALVDMRMPGSPDGEAMRQLASRFPGLPMLVITGHGQLTPPLPHAGYFNKPVSPPVLLEAMERLYQLRRKP